MIHRSKKAPPVKIDPLFLIFEQHLYNFENDVSDRKVFVAQVVAEYLAYLKDCHILIPVSHETLVISELGTQVNLMLTKKIYGCFSVDEFRKKISLKQRRNVRKRYEKTIAHVAARLENETSAPRASRKRAA